MNDFDEKFLLRAIEKAEESMARDGFPAGAVIVHDGEIIGEGISIGDVLNDPTAHGEIAAIRYACRNISSSKLKDCVLYASLQPCLMCLAASAWAVIPKIVYACAQERVSDEYYGGSYSAVTISKDLINAPLLVHSAAFEERALAVVTQWEKMQEQ